MKFPGPDQSYSGEIHQSTNPSHMHKAFIKCFGFSLHMLEYQGLPYIWGNPLTWVTETKTNHRENLEN